MSVCGFVAGGTQECELAEEGERHVHRRTISRRQASRPAGSPGRGRPRYLEIGIRVLELAHEIITSQQREIAEMNWLIDDIGENGLARTESDASARLVPDFGPETPPRRFKSGR